MGQKRIHEIHELHEITRKDGLSQRGSCVSKAASHLAISAATFSGDDPNEIGLTGLTILRLRMSLVMSRPRPYADRAARRCSTCLGAGKEVSSAIARLTRPTPE